MDTRYILIILIAIELIEIVRLRIALRREGLLHDILSTRVSGTGYYFVSYLTGSMDDGTAKIAECFIQEHPCEWLMSNPEAESLIFWAEVPKHIAVAGNPRV